MGKTTENNKIQEQAEQIQQAAKQIVYLTRINQELKTALLDKNVNEVRRIESFQLLRQAWGNPAYLKERLKIAKSEKWWPQELMVIDVDILIETLTKTAQGGEVETENPK